jgi:hypothetical protein
MNHAARLLRVTLPCASVLVASILTAPPALAQSSDTFKPGGAGSPAPKPGKSTKPKERPAKTPAKDASPRDDAMIEEGKKVLSAPGATSGAASPGKGWSVFIAAFRGDDKQAQAEEGLRRVRTLGGLPEAFIEARGEALVVAYGSFAEATSPEARAALERVRTMEIEFDGKRGKPFESAVLVPPEAASAGTIPEYDLRQARKQNAWAIYTLQVAFYGKLDGPPATPQETQEFRKAAEEAAVRLRREGDLAFYYHGQRGSTVTVGLFGADDFVAAQGAGKPEYESPALKALRKRYPNNLVNGAGVRQTVSTIGADGQMRKTAILQPSGLVGVPKD